MSRPISIALLEATQSTSPVTLPSGRVLDLHRSRWDGVLATDDLDYCRAHGIPVAYDCAQIGWVPDSTADEPISELTTLGRRGGVTPPVTVDVETSALRLRRAVEAATARLLDDVRQGRQSADDVRPRLASVAEQVLRGFASDHGAHSADLCRWALQAVVARALADVRGARHATPPDDAVTFTFRPWSPDDAEAYRQLLGNPNVWRYLPEPFPSPFTDETARLLIDAANLSFKQDAVAIVVDGEPIGQCLLRFDRPFAGTRAAEVAYWLGEKHWGQRWMGKVLPAFTYRSFARHDVDVIYAWIHPENLASVRAVERAGYDRDRFVGEARLAEQRGRRGCVRYATFRADWPPPPRLIRHT